MTEAFIRTGVRTPIGRYGGAPAAVRPDNMAGRVLRELMARAPGLPAPLELQECGASHALCSMCIGVGQGIALAMEKA